MMKKLTFLLAGILLLCGCQQVLIQPDRVTGIYAQAEFETARTALPQSMQDDVLEVLASLSFGQTEDSETAGVRIDVEEGDAVLSFYCGTGDVIRVSEADGSMQAAEDAAAAETLRGLLKECNAAYFQSELSAEVTSVDGDTVNVNASAASGAIAEGTALSFTLDQSVNNTLNGALQEGAAVLIVYDAEGYDAQSGQIGKVFVLTEAQKESASHGCSYGEAADC